jgi:hypothetical protein
LAGAAYRISASLQGFLSGDAIFRDRARTSELRGGIRFTIWGFNPPAWIEGRLAANVEFDGERPIRPIGN